jgi:hypothetical protein
LIPRTPPIRPEILRSTDEAVGMEAHRQDGQKLAATLAARQGRAAPSAPPHSILIEAGRLAVATEGFGRRSSSQMLAHRD